MKKEQGGIRQTFDFFYFAVRFFCEKYGKVRVFCSVVLGEILPTPLAPYTTHSTKGGGGSHLAWRREGRREGKAGKSFSFFFSSPFISLPSSLGATPPPPLSLPHLGRIEWKEEEEEAIIIIVLSRDQRSEAMFVNAPIDAEKERHILLLSTTFTSPHKTWEMPRVNTKCAASSMQKRHKNILNFSPRVKA